MRKFARRPGQFALGALIVLSMALAMGNAAAQVDSTAVDSTVVDSTAVDSTAVDSTIAPAVQAAPAVAAPPPAAQPPAAPPPAPATAQTSGEKKQMFFGGTVGVSFGDYTSISIEPMVGWYLRPRVAAGFKGIYEYVEDERYTPKVTASNYGGSAFGRFFPRRSMYAHAEFAYISYEYSVANQQTQRDWVPFLLLGGGVVRPMGGRAAVFVEVLFDVLQDENSPYDDWTPFVSFGVGVGM